LIYTKQSKLKVVKLIELNNKCKTAASCKDIVRCTIRRNSADRYAYENISSKTVMFCCVKVMRLDCFRLLLLLTKVITSLSLQLLNQGKYHQLVSDVASCITASGQQFSSGMTFYSNPKSQMGT
jgi:hypothetical protein